MKSDKLELNKALLNNFDQTKWSYYFHLSRLIPSKISYLFKRNSFTPTS